VPVLCYPALRNQPVNLKERRSPDAEGGLIRTAGQIYNDYLGMRNRASDLMVGSVQRAAKLYAQMAGAGNPVIKAFIHSLDSHPYVWGGSGPWGFDCSGIVSAVLGKMLGMRGAGAGLRLFTTGSIGAGMYGLRSGLGGTLQIGVTPGSGHMVGRYGGLGFEARSSRTGIFVGASARTPSSMARHFYHLASGGLISEDMVRALQRLGMDVGGDAGRTRINGQVLDRGGWLQPGWNLSWNGTGRRERVSRPGEGGIVVNFNGPVYGDRQALARAVKEQLKTMANRTGNKELGRILQGI
jgi:NlpC/P60 family